MQARVIKAFIDKKTDEAHKVGETVELTKGRFDELRLRGFVTTIAVGDKEELEELRKENASLLNDVKDLSEKVKALTEENELLKKEVEKEEE